MKTLIIFTLVVSDTNKSGLVGNKRHFFAAHDNTIYSDMPDLSIHASDGDLTVFRDNNALFTYVRPGIVEHCGKVPKRRYAHVKNIPEFISGVSVLATRAIYKYDFLEQTKTVVNGNGIHFRKDPLLMESPLYVLGIDRINRCFSVEVEKGTKVALIRKTEGVSEITRPEDDEQACNLLRLAISNGLIIPNSGWNHEKILVEIRRHGEVVRRFETPIWLAEATHSAELFREHAAKELISEIFRDNLVALF